MASDHLKAVKPFQRPILTEIKIKIKIKRQLDIESQRFG